MIKFLHAADIHLDSPLKGLEAYEDAPVEAIRGASRNALQNLVRAAIEHRVQFVVIAGDVYDGDWQDYRTGMFFVGRMAQLAEAGIDVFLIRGNHDAASKITKELTLPRNVHLFAADRARVIEREDLGVAIHGQSFATQAVCDDLSLDYPAPLPGLVNIGVLHTCLDGREGHERYAPCSLQRLLAKGYDYWALGHIHGAEVVHNPAAGEPAVVFSGNLQGRHIRETGPKGAMLVEIDRGPAKLTPLELDVFRWERCVVDLSGLKSLDAAGEAFERSVSTLLKDAGELPLAVRLEFRGATDLHDTLFARGDRFEHEIRSRANQVGPGRLWVEKIKRHTTPPRRAYAEGDDGPVASLRAFFQGLADDPQALADLTGELADLRKALPAQLRGDDAGLDLASIDAVRQALEPAALLIEAELTGDDASLTREDL